MTRELPDIETRWWNLMNHALNEKLCIRLEKHFDSRNFTVLHVKVFPIDRKPDCLISRYDIEHSTKLFFEIEKFVDDYKKS